jgi:hypothetical protein
MVVALSLADEERGRVVRMTVDALDRMIAEASLRLGEPDEETNAQLPELRKETWDRLDAGLALDLADRLGEDALREAVGEYSPPIARAAIGALAQREGGMLPLVKSRISRMEPATDATFTDSDAFGCALGAFAIVSGVALDTILGGIAAVGGILVMADAC